MLQGRRFTLESHLERSISRKHAADSRLRLIARSRMVVSALVGRVDDERERAAALMALITVAGNVLSETGDAHRAPSFLCALAYRLSPKPKAQPKQTFDEQLREALSELDREAA